MRRRIWCEFLPPEELGAAATVDLLGRFGLEPIVALPPHGQTPAMAEALARLSKAGVRVGVWPLLSDDEGYWPSEPTARAFGDRVRAALAFADEAGAKVQTVAVDLEPPLETLRQLMSGPLTKRARVLIDEAPRLRTPERRAERREAAEVFASLATELRGRDIETIAALIPLVALDFAFGTRFWQALLRTPADKPGWSVLSPMVYTTMIAPLFPFGGKAAARALVRRTGRAMVAKVGRERASLSLGAVQAGKLGDEPAYEGPDELRRDVEAAVSSGVDDLALFCLEGVLNRGAPEDWLVPYTEIHG